ncbi:hypothetical protein RRG08_063377 [Elysia crispata]|uniref:Uncharacterized protein n=1 Tax=Elysia crispata TaxID=231223 RepID=A0AAE1B3S0_9GAST|nr:hypothetical protein RRG08_063377 [Elysia crispata]
MKREETNRQANRLSVPDILWQVPGRMSSIIPTASLSVSDCISGVVISLSWTEWHTCLLTPTPAGGRIASQHPF